LAHFQFPDGIVNTFAGTGTRSSVNGACATATFDMPMDIKIDEKDGSFLVAEYTGQKIRRISPQGLLCYHIDMDMYM
jgi:hypothetical protein